MDLIWTAWQPSNLSEGGDVFIPANFGIMGGARYDLWEPTFNPPPDIVPTLPQSNDLAPVVVGKVTDINRFQAIEQASITQLSQIRPATYVAPGTASVVVG